MTYKEYCQARIAFFTEASANASSPSIAAHCQRMIQIWTEREINA